MMIHYIKNQIITLNIDLFLVDLGGHVESDVTPWLIHWNSATIDRDVGCMTVKLHNRGNFGV
jgi:hypothetical protein